MVGGYRYGVGVLSWGLKVYVLNFKLEVEREVEMVKIFCFNDICFLAR